MAHTVQGPNTSTGVAASVTDETGTGPLVFSNSPTLVTPNLGTPSFGNLSNCTAFPLENITGFGAEVSAFLVTPTDYNLKDMIANSSGTGGVVFTNSPTLVTPTIGAASATSINFGGTSLANYAQGTFTPSFTNLTVVNGTGEATYTGFYTRVGDIVFWEVLITTTGTCTTASTATSTYFTGLQAQAGTHARPSTFTVVSSGFNSYGVGYLGNEAATPTWAATTDDIYISGTYKVA